MKIEFLPDGDPYCPLIRLFAYRSGEIENLQQACTALADGSLAEFRLHDQPWVEPVGGCTFTWRAAGSNRGTSSAGNGAVLMEYAREGWLEIADKLAPMLGEPAGCFQLLTNEGDVEVVVSLDGLW